MANPYGNIAGVSDVSEPGWQDRLAQMVHNGTSETARASARMRRSHISSQVDEEFSILLARAARMRDIQTTGYVRRAIAAFVAADLGLAITDVLQFGSMPGPAGTLSTAGRRTSDDGTGFGSWEVKV